MKKLLIALAAVGIVLTAQLIGSQAAHGISAGDFDAGRIIDDEVFYDKDSMSVAEIQKFLDSHVPACDTWGTQRSGYGNLTRAQYAQQVMGWHGPPYSCLNNYHENPSNGSTSFENGGGWFSGGVSAAQIIYNTAQQYRISPKVLLITLRKEALNIFGDSWPLKSQYKYAMGYACPDSGPNYSANCQSSKAGFYNQVTYAAWQMRTYYDRMDEYNYAPGRWNTIQYNPNPSCGTKNVFIQNKATASLYIYTPYTPNDAALNAYPGEAHCGAYGNRNFWYMWQEWFGSTYGAANLVSDLSLSQEPTGAMYTGKRTASFTIKNYSNSTIDLGSVGVASSSPTGRTDGFAMKRVVLAPRESYTYTDTQSHFNEEGQYRFWIVANNGNGCVYCTDQPSSANQSIIRSWNVYVQNPPTITEGLKVTQARAMAGEAVEATFKVKNNSSRPVALGSLGVSLHDSNGSNIGMTMTNNITLPANSEQVISSTRVLPSTGSYKAAITGNINDVWSGDFPASSNSSVQREMTFSAKEAVTLQQTPALSNPNPRVGESIGVTIPIKNFSTKTVADGQIGLAVYDPDGANVGYAMQEFVIQAGQTFNYNVPTRQFTKPGTYSAQIVQYKNGAWRDYSSVESSDAKTSFKFTVQSNLTLQAKPTLSAGTPRVGQVVTPSFTLRNYAGTPVSGASVGLAIYDPQGRNVGYAMQDVTAAANGTFTYNVPGRAFTTPGKYTAWIVQYKNGAYVEYDAIEQGVGTSKFTFDVREALTLTATPSLSVTSPYAGQSISATIPIKNHSDSVVTGAEVGLAVYDSRGASVGFAMKSITLGAGETFTYDVPSRLFTEPGIYSAHLVQYRNGIWSDYSQYESGSVQNTFKFTVQSNLALQAKPTLSTATPRVGQVVTPSFTLRNNASTAAAGLSVGLAIYDPQGRNVGYAMQDVTAAANGTFTYNVPGRAFTTPGKYTAWIVQYKNGAWVEYDTLAQGVGTSKFTFDVQP